jgi:dTDP-4-amino-4,6-dideoxygalactose transaminase
VGLYGILKGLGIGNGDEVIIPAPTHIVVANAVNYTGAIPVYADCKLIDFNIDIDDVLKKITDKTKAIILQHTFGVPCEIDLIKEMICSKKIAIIENCVHSLGAKYAGRMVGSFGIASIYSTEESKMISSTMGGMVTTDNSKLADYLRKFSNLECKSPSLFLTYSCILKFALYYFLMNPNIHKYSRFFYELFGEHLPLPRPASKLEYIGQRPKDHLKKLSNSQSRIALRQLNRLEQIVGHRNKIAQVYKSLLRLKGLRDISYSINSSPSFVRYPIWVTDKKKAMKEFTDYGTLGDWFSSVLHDAYNIADSFYIKGSCPNAELASKHMVNLPTHIYVKERDAITLFKSIEKFID